MKQLQYFIATFSILFLLLGCSSNNARYIVKDVEIDSIQITPASVTVPKGTTGIYTAIAYKNDGTTENVSDKVQFHSSKENIVAFSATKNNHAEAIATGNSEITATIEDIQEGITITSNVATVKVTDATLLSIEITPVDSSLPKGTTQNYTAFGLYSDNTHYDLTNFVSWKSSQQTIATINESGVALTRATGTTEITATFEEVTSNSASLTVTDATLESIQITPSDAVVPLGTTGVYTATAYYSDNSTVDVSTTVTWSAAETAVISIVSFGDNAGHATAVATGTTTITALLEDVTSNEATVEVTDATLKSIQITPLTTKAPAGIDVKYQATGIYSDSSTIELTLFALWKSSHTKQATIDAQGKARTLLKGNTVISASFEGLESNQAQLTVTSALVTSIQVTPASSLVPRGTQDRFLATAYYSDGTSENITEQATWQAADSAIVAIMTSGEFAGYARAENPGTTTVSASFHGITSNNAFIEVTDATLTSIHIEPHNEIQLPNGLKFQYRVWGIYSDATSKDLTEFATWSSSETDIATIFTGSEDAGIAHGVSEGETNIKALFEDKEDTVTLLITNAIIESLQVTPTDVTIPKGTQSKHTATAYYSNGRRVDVPGLATWQTEDSTVATVVASGENGGLVTAVEVGSTTMTALYEGVTSNTVHITVGDPKLETLKITPLNAEVPEGITQKYTVLAIYSDSTSIDVTSFSTLKSSDTSVATIVDNVAYTHTQSSGITISATYNGFEVTPSATLVVTDAVVESLQVTPTDVAIPKGTQSRHTATAYYSNGRSVDVPGLATWQTEDSTVATVVTSGENGGLVTAVEVGSTIMTAVYEGITSNKVIITVTEQELDNIQITPNYVEVAIGKTVTYTVYAIYKNHTQKDVTEFSSIRSLDTSIATVVGNIATAHIPDKQVFITATYDGIETKMRATLRTTNAE
ncbi:Ig-like domain-containing protein [bacterium]|nr:Ig-like domain-containing protein [bacterium]